MRKQLHKIIDKILEKNDKQNMLYCIDDETHVIDWSDKFDLSSQEQFNHLMNMVFLIKELPEELVKDALKEYRDSNKTFYDIIKGYKVEE